MVLFSWDYFENILFVAISSESFCEIFIYMYKLNIKYGDIQIDQHSKVKYLACLLDESFGTEGCK